MTDDNNVHHLTPSGRPNTAGGNGGGNFGERLARIEARMDYMATKEDIQKLRVWVLAGILASVVIVVGAARLFTE